MITEPKVATRVEAPIGGVSLNGGLFGDAFRANIDYLLNCSDMDNMLFMFRKAAGVPNPPGKAESWWESRFPSHAAQFLMGAGNALRWVEHEELRRRMDELIDGMEACVDPEGHLRVPGVEGLKDHWAYSLQMLAHGLLAADAGGQPKALPRLREMIDWCNSYLGEREEGFGLTRGLNYTGQIAFTLMYHTRLGKPADRQTAERTFIPRDWMKWVADRNPDAIWKDSPKWPHCMLIILFQAYLDHYRATGERRYLDAALGGWDLFRENWQHVGGSIAICEGGKYPPKCYPVSKKRHVGELCGSVLWVRLNHLLHQLYPDQEQYVAEIEKSIYNVGLAGQGRQAKGYFYHLLMEGRKTEGMGPTTTHTCCEGNGTWLIGSLPQYIYSLSADGLYVNLFAPSTITRQLGSKTLRAEMDTRFPFAPEVSIRVRTDAPVAATLHVRVPSWVTGPVSLSVNGKKVASGQPESYVPIERIWADGDELSFRLPGGVRVTKYVGEAAIEGHDRFAIEYGPILLAVAGDLGKHIPVQIPQDPGRASAWLKPTGNEPLHFRAEGLDSHEIMPYFHLADDQAFTAYPVIGR
jgi:hypothetical protein